MTIPPKLYESFKSLDFDIEYFVSEAIKSRRLGHINSQLDQGLEFVDSELRKVAKESSDIILSVANSTDTAIGELLAARELFGALKDSMEQLNRQEVNSLDRIRQKHAQLKKAIEISAFVKKVSRISSEVPKLKAQFPDLAKEKPHRNVLESVSSFNDLKELGRVDLIKDEVAWLEAAYETRKKQESPEKKRTSPSKPVR